MLQLWGTMDTVWHCGTPFFLHQSVLVDDDTITSDYIKTFSLFLPCLGFGEQVSSSPWPVTCLQLVLARQVSGLWWRSFDQIPRFGMSSPFLQTWTRVIGSSAATGNIFAALATGTCAVMSCWDCFVVELLDMDAIDMLAGGVLSQIFLLHYIEVQKELIYISGVFFGGGELWTWWLS